jgi:hypothetical protein
MMRSMTRVAVAGCLALAALGAVAVLDVGSRAAEAAPSVSPFAGSWSGTWSAEGEVRGTFEWTISNAGRISGTLTHAGRTDGVGGMVGHVRADGTIKFVGMVPDDTPGNLWGNGFPFKGTAVIDGDGRLVASVDGEAPIQGSLVVILERNEA